MKPISLAAYITSTFRIYDKSGSLVPLELDVGQLAAVNAIEFGYDINKIPRVPSRVPTGIIMNWPRQRFGKTTACAATVGAYLVLGKHMNIGCISKDEDSCLMFKDRVSQLLHTNPTIDKMLKQHIGKETVDEIHFNNNHFKSHPNSRAIRGNSYNILIADEAAFIDDEHLRDDALPTTFSIGWRWIMLSTPLGSMRTTYFGQCYAMGLASRPIICSTCLAQYKIEDFPNVKTYGFDLPTDMLPCKKCGNTKYEFGVGEYSVIPVDALNSKRVSKDEILHQLEIAGNTPLARQEILGEFIDEAALVFREEWLQACTNFSMPNFNPPQKGFYYVMGVDFGKYHDSSSFAITHIEGGKTILDCLFTKEPSTIAAQKWDYKDVREDIIRLCKMYNVSAIAADSTGIGDAVLEELRTDLRAEGLNIKLLSNKSERLGYVIGSSQAKTQIISLLESLFTSTTITLPTKTDKEIRKFWEEAFNFSYEITDSGVKYGTQNFHDDRIIAVGLSCWGNTLNKWFATKNAFAGEYGKYDGNERLQARKVPTSCVAGDWSTGSERI